MTRDEEINHIKYKVCCPVCDNDKCVRGTDSCEAEMWARDKKKSECMEDFDEEELPKKKTFWIHDMDITFDKELTHEEMEKRLFGALKNAGVIGHRGCPN